jgi:hypothetical protein
VRQIQVTEYLRKQQLKLNTGELGYLGMDPVPKKMSYLVPSLTLVEEVPEDTHPTEGISFQLKQRANSTAAPTSATTYKIVLHRFDEGTVAQWITLRGRLQEIWTQNAIIGPTDQLATVRSILRGESLTCLNAFIEEQSSTTNAQGVVANVALTNAGVLAGLDAVAETVFPFRALSNQKLWMRRGMKKPKELSFRKTAAAVGRLNNSLPLFPSATAADKFSDEEVVELLEWSIPQAWRTKFDLDGYIPTGHNKARLIRECEILERNDPMQKNAKVLPKNKEKPSKKGTSKFKNGSKYTTDKKAGYYCTEHGSNPTHNTDSCYTLKNKSKKTDDSGSMTKKSFRREINLLSLKRPKKKVIEMFALVLGEERKKAAKKQKAKKSKKKAREQAAATTSSSESDSDESMHAIDTFKSRLRQQRAKKRKVQFDSMSDTTHESNESPEEKNYKETIQSLGVTQDKEDSLESSEQSK